MTETTSRPGDDTFAPGEQVQVISFLATDDELLLLLQDDPGALAKLYPEGEGEDELARGVANAVKRSLVARRAVVRADDGQRLELLQPWAGLVEHLGGGERFCRITIDGDDRSARLVMVGDDALFTVDRDPSGIHTVTISIPEFAAQVISERFVQEHREEDGAERTGETNSPALGAVRISAASLVEGRQLLAQGADDEAAAHLGAATEHFRLADRTFRVETMQVDGTGVHGSEFDVLDAGSLGWLQVAYADDRSGDLIVASLSDEALETALLAALTS